MTFTIYVPKVNFSTEIITLAKEFKIMKWLFVRIPLSIVNKAHNARQMYPYTISLVENVNTYAKRCEGLSENRTCQLLVVDIAIVT